MSVMPVEELLISKGVQYKSSGQSFLVKCINPDHADNNPSCSIDKVSGIFRCFSCGYSGNIFRHYGILTDSVSLKVVKLKDKLRTFVESTRELEPIKGLIPFTGTFRGISQKTLKHFNASRTYDDPRFADRIIFPITDISNEVYSYIGRHMFSDESPKYLIHPRKVQQGIFPVLLEPGTTSVVMVEGIFDMLNMYDNGITNTVCCFGVNSITEKTLAQKLLPLRIQGVNKIFILFDGDKAGRQGAKDLQPLIEDFGIQVEILELDDGDDPGSLEYEVIEQIKEHISCQKS